MDMIGNYALRMAVVALALAATEAPAQHTKQDITRTPTARQDGHQRTFTPGQLSGSEAPRAKSHRSTNPSLFRGGAPVNDNCAGAITIPVGTSCVPVAGSTAGATSSLPAITCNSYTGTADDDVWFKFVATAPAITVLVDGSAQFDAVVDVRSGACNGANIACADQVVDDGTEMVSLTGLTVGATYLVRVYDYYNGPAPTTDLTICAFITPPPPANDQCANVAGQNLAIGGSLTFTGSTAGATTTNDAAVGSAFEGAVPTVWHRFTTTACANVTLDYCGTAPAFDEVYIVLTPDCPADSAILGTYDFTTCPDGNGTVVFNQLPAGSYYVPVGLFGAGSLGAYTIHLNASACGVAPPNDQCQNIVPQALNVGGSLSFTGTTVGATATNDAVPLSDMDDSVPKVWHAFTLSSCANVQVSYCGTTPVYDQIYIVLTACPASTFELGTYDFTTCADGNGTVYFSALPAGTYYLPVGQFGAGTTGPYTLEVSATACAGLPANDECGGATMLTAGTLCQYVTGDVANATGSLPAISCNGFTGDANDDVWFSFVATAAALTVEVAGSDSLDAVVELLSGGCANPTSIGCADATLEGGTEVIQAAGLTVGQTYHVRLYHYYTDIPATTTFDICVYGGGAAPVNDNCADVVSQPLAIGGNLSFTGTTVGATAAGDAVAGSPMDDNVPKVWHAFTLVDCADVTVSYCGTNPAFDQVYIVWTSCPADTFHAGTYDTTSCADGNVTIRFATLQPGTYWLPVGQFGSGTTGPYTLTVEAAACPGQPTNDDCADAIGLPVWATTDCPQNGAQGNNAQATQDAGDPSCDTTTGSYLDMWYAFNSGPNTVVTINFNNVSMGDAVVVVYDGCNGTELSCVIGPGAPYDVTVTPNTDHVVRVYSNTQYGAGGEFSICLSAAISTALAEVVDEGWSLFPNPGTGAVSVVWPWEGTAAQLQLIDATGRTVWNARTTLVKGVNAVREDAGTLKAGTYVLRIRTEAGISEQRLLVH